MDTNQKYSCTSEIGAEALMFITSSIMFIILCAIVYQSFILFSLRKYSSTASDKIVDTVLSSVFALFLPLMSYMFSQAKENSPARARVILTWVVLAEVIQAEIGDSTWELKKSFEQIARFVWVGYLLYSYKPLNFLRAILLVLSVLSIIFEVLKGITRSRADDSYLLGKNPKLIHDYMNIVMLQDDLRTTPMSRCAYIVMGEENHEIKVCKKGYHLCDKNSNSEAGMLTIGRVFQLNSEDEAFTSANPDWRDTCLSFALAKMLRRRFVNISLDEAGSSKALQFVQEGLIDYIGSNKDIPPERSNEDIIPERSNKDTPRKRRNGDRNPDRVFAIIQDELNFVSEFLHSKVPALNYVKWRVPLNFVGFIVMEGIFSYLFYTNLIFLHYISYQLRSSTSPSPNVQDYSYSYSHRTLGNWIYIYDQFITSMLAGSCLYIATMWWLALLGSKRWINLWLVKRYIENPTKQNKSHRFVAPFWINLLIALHNLNIVLLGNMIRRLRFSNKKEKIHYSIFGKKNHGRTCHTVGKWIRGEIGRLILPTISHSADVKEAILRSLRNSSGQLTNGDQTALKNHGMSQHLNLLCGPSGSTTEAILVWHIATTLLFNHQEQQHRQNNDPFKKEREVALDLSNYCLHLIARLPELLPDEAEWTEKMYESVREEIYHNDLSLGQKPTAINRCNYAIGADVTWEEKSLVGKGAKLTRELVDCADNGTQVWTMLSEFWAEMMLFIAPSDNVEGHKEILDKEELITQLWALLTHAGILTRPKCMEHPNHGIESNEVAEEMNV